MKATSKHTGVLSAVLVLVMTGPAFAQVPVQSRAVSTDASEQDRLVIEVARAISAPIDLRGMLSEAINRIESKACAAKPSNCPELFRQSVEEELDASMPHIELMVGRRLTAGLTLPELRAGVAFLTAPNVKAAMAAAHKGEGSGAAEAELTAATERFKKTAEGRAFIAKMEGPDIDGADQYDQTVLERIMLGVERRFREKAQVPKIR